ncbi:MAG: hypothetical protein RJA22_2907 [Verrucomicrobiota bacterium]|jgi:hypothetical protein
MPPPDHCPVCGSPVPPKARACPECGADDQTGWSERADAQRLGLPDDEFDYNEFVREEFGQERPATRLKPKGLAWHWWATAIVLLAIFLAMLLGLFGCTTSPAPGVAGPADWRHRLSAAAFRPTGPQEWTSHEVRAPWAFDELIYAWQLARTGDTFRVHLQVVFGPGEESAWLYAGSWGALPDPSAKRAVPRFDRGVLDMDWLKLTTPARGVRFRIVGEGGQPPAIPPGINLVATDNRAQGPRRSQPAMAATAAAAPARVLDVPLRRQLDSQGRRLIDKCQSAALASAMEYFGKPVPLEDIVRHTFDPEYQYPGIWPRVLAAAQEFGFASYLDRFRTWPEVRQALAENKILLCSMRLRPGEAEAPPYPSMGNHIVALCGVTDDGRVVVTDSFLGRNGLGYLCQWRQADFEKAWMRAKGGIAMVICPPPGAAVKEVRQLPPFPADRGLPAGDPH